MRGPRVAFKGPPALLMSREDSSITYSSLLLMAKIEVTSLAFFLSCSFSLRFINQSRANREGTIAKLCVEEAETWVQSYFTHCLSVTWLSTHRSLAPEKKLKVSAFEDVSFQKQGFFCCRYSIPHLLLSVPLCSALQQQNAGKSALL